MKITALTLLIILTSCSPRWQREIRERQKAVPASKFEIDMTMKITYYTDGAEIRMKNRRAFVSTQDDLVLLKFWRVDGSTQPRAVHAPIRNCGAYTSIKLDRDTLAAIYMVLAEEGKRQINRSEIPNNSQIKTETK